MLQNVNDFLNFDDAPPDFQPTPSPESGMFSVKIRGTVFLETF